MRRDDFPLLKKTIYLDSGAGTLKPLPVIAKVVDYYKNYPINNHSTDSKLGEIVIKKINQTRKIIANLVDCKMEEIIFTTGTTDGINKISRTLDHLVNKGDEIIISEYAHSSNAAPWIQLAKRNKAKIIMSNDIINDINQKTKIVAFAQINNSIHKENDIAAIYQKVKAFGGVLINDAAQAINSTKVTIKNADVIVFSGTKLYGPTGSGALIIKKEFLKTLKPEIVGGGSVMDFDANNIWLKPGFDGFEPGTLNVAGIIGMGAGIEYMVKYDDFNHKKKLVKYAFDKLSKIKDVQMISQRSDYNVLFKIKNIPAQDIVSYLGNRNIILRAGKQCALYLFSKNKYEESIRMSFGLYNEKSDIDTTIKIIKKELKKGGGFLDIT